MQSEPVTHQTSAVLPDLIPAGMGSRIFANGIIGASCPGQTKSSKRAIVGIVAQLSGYLFACLCADAPCEANRAQTCDLLNAAFGSC